MVGDDQDACNALHARQPEKQSFAACRPTAALGSLQKFAAETTNVVHWLIASKRLRSRYVSNLR